MLGAKAVGAVVGLKIVCCGGLLLVASGAVAASQLAWTAALLLAAAGVVLFVGQRLRCGRRRCREAGVAESGSVPALVAPGMGPEGGFSGRA